MNNEVLALLISGASKFASELIRYKPIKLDNKPTTMQPTEVVRFTATTPTGNGPRKPTTAETVGQLEGRLLRQMLRLQEDLLEGARINGQACDCLLKHTNEMDITAEELQTMSQKPIYQEIRNWALSHQWPPEVVAEHPPEFFIDMVPELRNLRKGLTEAATPLPKPAEPLQLTTKTEKPELARVRELAGKVKAGELSKEEAVSQIKTMLAGKFST
ncbi:MAG: hypothetical protein PHN44_00615 [Candidatus Marinimicrobia bacterium]|nr:hypothetical protein [Candidatus Neomarinimicrobiota bacterium]MDD5539132.1 hypothetical protein [Candidatus Neomarinimicrobiota bacterium]